MEMSSFSSCDIHFDICHFPKQTACVSNQRTDKQSYFDMGKQLAIRKFNNFIPFL